MNAVEIKAICRICEEEKTFNLDKDKVKRWHNGEYIQDVFPELSAGEREILISGVCDTCFDNLFKF